ncbi:MAG: hypothetical protein II664_09430, partial [Oscillospiraceae bacterium]|nr:hypothetical protein [Oscillospiraceae bacterium]
MDNTAQALLCGEYKDCVMSDGEWYRVDADFRTVLRILLYIAMAKHLMPYVKAGKAELWVNFGDHLTMWEAFKKHMPEIEKEAKTYFDDYKGLSDWAETLDAPSKGGVTVFCNKNIFEAVYSTNLLMRKCDVLITKPSELAFYPVPKLMMR